MRKVIQFDRNAPKTIKSVSYFGFYRRNAEAEGMKLPQAFSVYSAEPDSKKRNDETKKVSGRLTIRINAELTDGIFAPNG